MESKNLLCGPRSQIAIVAGHIGLRWGRLSLGGPDVTDIAI
jgi:hypothetical protein